MGNDIVSDGDAADEMATGLDGVDFPGVVSLPYPVRSTLGGLVEGVSLGNSCQGSFEDLKGVMVAKTAGLRQITEAFAAVDAALARGSG